MKFRKLLGGGLLAAVLALGGVAGLTTRSESKEAGATDYSSTIRVYAQFTSDWTDIGDVRFGGKETINNAVLTSSDAKYNQDLGQYVKDISSSSTFGRMGFYFFQGSVWFQYQYDGGEVWRDGGFRPGYEYQMKNIHWTADKSGYKEFGCDVYEIGQIRDNAQNSTFYFVDGYSWHHANAYFWGGTASCVSFPGEEMSDSSLRLKAYVGETEYAGLHIYQYTLTGSAAYVVFSNNGSSKTEDLALVDGGVYWYGVNDTYEPVVRLLLSLKTNLGAYSYEGRSFSSSICALDKTKAKAFVDTYDNLVATGGSGIASSVPGSGIITYDTPETSNTHTGEVSLESVRTSLINKYPTLDSTNRINPIIEMFGMDNSTPIMLVVIISVVSLTAVGGYIFLKRRKED